MDVTKVMANCEAHPGWGGGGPGYPVTFLTRLIRYLKHPQCYLKIKFQICQMLPTNNCSMNFNVTDKYSRLYLKF